MGKVKRIPVRMAGLVAVVAIAGALSFAGWAWVDRIVVREVMVEGARYADEESLLALTAVDTSVRVLDVDPLVVADRVVRHPWVQTGVVRRLPSGVVRIAVKERLPVALALTSDGQPAAWLDAEGHAMPLSGDAAWDVPLVWGAVLPENRTQPLREASLRELLATLPESDPLQDVLVSSFEVDRAGGITMYAAIPGSKEAIAVRLGSRDYTEKFRRLHAFWMQAVLPSPDKIFTTIDLRFDGQIVTKES